MAFVEAGQELARLHVHFEDVAPYAGVKIEYTKVGQPSYRVKQMKWGKIKGKTGNAAKGADAAAHGAYLDSAAGEDDLVSWHYTVDDHAIVQHLPDYETAYHAGDGKDGPGNATSIAVEICVNAGGDFEAAKANGYEALHSTVMGPDGVWVEVQIRTQRMEDIAERGFAAHWKYKHATISQDEDEFDKWLKQIRSALNSPTENAVDFLDNFKLSLYTSEIVVFTPKGEARKMPFGATALDFAYDIHSKIGNSAISAKINHKLEPITTQINSGDQIEIITADNARPKPEWLEIVTTAKAKQSIKSFLKRERQNNIERGMHMLDEKMKSLNIKLSGRVLRKIVPIYESNNKEELYSKIGAGIVNLDNLEKVLKVNSKSKILKFWTLFINKKEEEDGDDATAPGETAPEKEPAAEPQFEIAECCKPIPGDKVVGYRDPATGNIIVHKANCDELDRLAAQFGKNIVKDEIKWSQHKAMSYLVTIELRGIDRMGILLDLAKVVSGDFSINIREVSIHSHDGIFEGSISLYVKDAEGLHDVMDKLRKIKGIESVKRTLS